MSKIKTLFKNLGPGLLFASMAIGTSHLVLSTKAGAQYGLIMVIPIVLANIFKYPFFEFGVRYTNVTNKTLIEGYLNRGKGYLWFYAFLTLITTFTILAALYTVTAGLFINLFKICFMQYKYYEAKMYTLFITNTQLYLSMSMYNVYLSIYLYLVHKVDKM